MEGPETTIQHKIEAGSQFQSQLAQPHPKAVPISKSALPITIHSREGDTAQYPVNQWIVAGEPVVSQHYRT